ncbi:MAG: YEATS-associated helix-containing protein [Bacteroidota bacterium]
MSTRSGLTFFLILVAVTFVLFFGWMLMDVYQAQPMMHKERVEKALNTPTIKEQLSRTQEALFQEFEQAMRIQGDTLNMERIQTPLMTQLEAYQDSTIQFLAAAKPGVDLPDEGTGELTDSAKFKLKILIIIAAGLLGGFARTRYKYLDEELMAAVEDLDEQTQSANKEIKERLDNVSAEDKEGLVPQATAVEMEADLTSMKEKLENLHDKVGKFKHNRARSEEQHSMVANLTFGLIASSLSILALDFINSKVLDFERNVDYFILWGWCILGAVFAKAWIQNLYDKIRDQTNQ